jgi:hypothetical protein
MDYKNKSKTMKTTLVIIQIIGAVAVLIVISPFILMANYLDYLYIKIKLR